MKLKELFDFYEGKDLEFNSLSINSKTINKDDLFLCIKGVNVDRHDYIDEAIKNGAKAIITSKDIDINFPYIKIDNLDEIWPKLYEKYYNYPQNELKIIGITGTDGKTSVATIIQKLIGNDTCGYIGTNGYSCHLFDKETNNTTPGPESLYKYLREFVDANIKYVALEASSEAFYYHRLDDISFSSAGLTNIASEHLNTHKTLENYIDCKKELFRKCKGYSILNSKDKYYEDFKSLNNNNLSYGYKENDDIYIKEFKCYPNKTEIIFIYQENEYNIISPLLGKFNVENLMCAYLICLSLGFDIDTLINNSDLAILTADDPRFEDVDEIIDMMLEKVKDAKNYIRITDRKKAIEYALSHANKDDLVLILGKGNERYMKIKDQKIPFYDVDIINEILKKTSN